jgi:hypothetical protein
MNAKAMIRSAAITIALVAVFTILSEMSPAVKGFFELFGHHWIGKSVLALVAFGGMYLVFARSGDNTETANVWLLIGSVIVSGLAIFGFYIGHSL